MRERRRQTRRSLVLLGLWRLRQLAPADSRFVAKRGTNLRGSPRRRPSLRSNVRVRQSRLVMTAPAEVALAMRRVVDDVRGMVVSASLHASNLMIYKTRNQKAQQAHKAAGTRPPATSSPAHRRERTRSRASCARELEPRC